MKRSVLAIAAILTVTLFQSCGGPASEAKAVCECYEQAREDKDRDKMDECDKMAKELDEKYKDDKEAREKMGEACDVW